MKCMRLCVIFLFCFYGLMAETPLGENFKLLSNDEIVVIDNYGGNGYFDIYEPETNSYKQSFNLPGIPFDVASGDINSSGYDEIIGLYSNSIYVCWYNGSSWQGQSYDLGKGGMKYAACGDCIIDSISPGCEIVTASNDSLFKWHWSPTGISLVGSSYASNGVYDVCCGDIDGDRYDEIVYLTSPSKSNLNLIYINEDGKSRVYPTSITPDEKGNLIKLSAGNLREDIKEEVVILEAGNWPYNDVIHFFEYNLTDSSFVEIKTMNVGHRGDRDISCGNADTDRYEEIFLLRDNKTVYVYNYDNYEGSFSLSTSDNPVKISAPDWDGDNAHVILTGGPYLCSSELWPSLVITLPPYHTGIVEGQCIIKYGEDYQINQNMEATFSLTAQTALGYGYKFPGGLLEANVNASIESGVKKNLRESSNFSWGSWYTISSDYNKNVVITTRTYYNGFFYKISDPKNLLGDSLNNDTVNMAVPIASGNIAMSVEDYLNYADTIDYLPKGLLLPVQQPGNIMSYPQGYVYPNGYSVPTEELLFMNHPIYAVVPQGLQGGWYIDLQETQVHESVLYSKGNLAGKLSGQIPNGPSFSFQVAAAIGAQKTHSFKVGQQLRIEATMGYIPDTLNFLDWYYEYSPYIYHASSDSGGYYVLNFMTQNMGPGYIAGIKENKVSKADIKDVKLAIYPKVFKNSINIKFQIPNEILEKQTPTLNIYDASGRLVRKYSGLNRRSFSSVWNGTDNAGHKVKTGVYFIQFKAYGFNKTEKILLVK